MADINTVHQALNAFCGDQPGIAIGKELLEYVLNKAISAMNTPDASGTLFQFPSNNLWDKMRVTFTLKVSQAPLSVTYIPLSPPQPPRPNQGDPIPLIKIDGLSIELGIFVDGNLFSNHSVSYSDLRAGFDITGRKLSLKMFEFSGEWKPNSPNDTNEFWRQMATLPSGAPFTPADKKRWEVQEQAYLTLAADALGTLFVESTVIPDILRMVKGFDFTGPMKLAGTTEIVMLSGPAAWQGGCPRRAANISFTSESTRRAIEAGQVLERDPPPDQDPDATYPPMGNPERVRNADLFIHLPTVFMQHRFDGIVKPSITFSDEGTIAIIRWHYEASVSPRPKSTLQISLTQVWPTEFKISCPLLVFGDAGAGVKIACVYVEPLAVYIEGPIDPFEVYFRIGFDPNAGDLYFESHRGDVNPQLTFRNFPPLGFPIDQIADFILGEVADVIVVDQATKFLNTSRFSLATFDLFKGFGPMSNVLATLPEQASTTYGVVFRKA